MPVVIEQTFPLGRFQARRWNQPPFDPNSIEWPPSPWRLLRAIAARWFQYCRETGDDDTACRDGILTKLGWTYPSFRLPSVTSSGPELRQYQPTDVKFTKKTVEPEMKRPLKTLVPDRSWAMSPDEIVFWVWNDVTLSSEESNLLKQVLRRIHYFGRAESMTCLHLRDDKEPVPETNCALNAEPAFDALPVLVNTSPDALIERLLMATGDKMLANRTIPEGTAWHYAKVSGISSGVRRPSSRTQIRIDPSTQVAHFALDGPVLPLVKNTVQIAEQFRAAVMSMFNKVCSRWEEAARYLRPEDGRYASPVLSGKTNDGTRLSGHSHAHYLPIADTIDSRYIRQVIVYASGGFEPLEIKALKRLRDVSFDQLSCRVQLIGLDDCDSLSHKLRGPSTTWISLTPFIAHRHAKKRDLPQNRDDKMGLFLAAAAQELCQKAGLPSVEAAPVKASSGQLPFYEFRRARRKAGDTAYTRTAGYLRLTFSSPVSGPLCLGYNSHFGMGLFKAITI